ncbi:MAG: DNA repair protein RecO [Phycisphaerales bacterium JB064]
MPPLHDDAICLRHSEWSETSQLATLLCREHGLVRGLARGSRRERSAFSGGFELLARGHVVFFEKPTRELANITAWDLNHTHAQLRTDLPSLWAAMFAVDLMQRALPVREPHPRSFDELATLLAMPTIGFDALTTYQWALLDEAGHKPDLEGNIPPAPSPRAVVYFLPESGRVEADKPAGLTTAWPMRGRTLAALRSITERNEEGPRPRTDFDTDTWTRAAAFLCTYWMWVLGRPIPAARAVFGDRIGLVE